MSSTGAKIWRYSLIGAAVLLALVLLLLTTISLALYTESGSRRVTLALLERVNALEGIHIASAGISGNLLRGLTLTELAIDIPAAKITAASARASWNPYSLLSGSFYLAELDVGTLGITLPETSDTTADTSDPISLLRIQPLPINIAIGSLLVSDITIVMPEQELYIDNIAMAAQLNGLELGIENLHLAAFDAVVDLSLQATLRDNIPLLASVNWEYQGPLFADYDLAVGTAAITGDLTNLTIQHELLAPEAIHSSGNVSAPLNPADLQLEFRNNTASLRLPFAGISDYLFDNVTLLTRWQSGSLAMELQSDLSGPLLPASTLSATGSLAGTSLNLSAASLHTATGNLSTSGQLDWSGPFSSAFNFTLSEQDPLQYLNAEIPVELGDLAASGAINFAIVNDEPNLRVVIDDVKGMISGYELTGAAAVNMVGAAVQIEHLRLNTIANEILLSGEYRDEIHLNWQLTAPELAQLLSGISGAANGSGTIDGVLDNPVISANLQIQDLQSGAASAGNVTVALAGTREQLRSTVRVEDIAFPVAGADAGSVTEGPGIALLALQAEGNAAAHTLTVAIESDFGNGSLTVAGGVDDLSAIQWQGNITAASLGSEFGNWEKQGGATALALSPTSVNIANSCWLLAATELCLGIGQSASNAMEVTATLANFPLSEFTAEPDSSAYLIASPLLPRLSQGISLDGTVSATLNGVIDLTGAPPQVDFSIIANDASLQIASAEIVDDAIADELVAIDGQRYNWDTLAVNGRWENSNWNLSGNAVLSQQNVVGTNLGLNGVVDSTLMIAANGDLAGEVTARFAELGWIQAFLPDASAVSGSLAGELDISGSLNAPLFAGEVTLENGSATISRLGITLSEAQSTIVVQSSGDVRIDGTLASETGALTYTGTITNFYNDARSLQATLSGDKFLLADIADLKLEVTPELTLAANRELIQLNGKLDIPLLDLTLLELPETAVDVSRDAVVVNFPENQSELERSMAANQSMLFNIPVAAAVNLTLGDAVNVSGFGMQATLDGDLDIQQRPDGRNLTYGELSIVEGSYTIYGQTLNLRQGKLLFFGAIDNPALDIRAVREAEGVTVGVLMNGTLKNIRSQLFSTPVLPDNDIIAVLVTGRPASEMGEQDGTAVLGAIASLGLDRGQGLTDQIRNTLGLDTLGINNSGNINSSTLTIGKYLTPDIFVRYGVGLFDRQSKVAIDYSLSERIILQAESGASQSIDLTYTVER